jgi:Tol biopolymer transport system component
MMSPRSILPPLLALAAALALGACDGADNALAPGDDAAATPVESAASVEAITATTAQRIVFTSSRKGGYDIFKMDPLGSSVVRLTTSSAWEFSPAWSHDNKRIALVRPRVGSSLTRYDIWVVNADGSNGHWARSFAYLYDLLTPTWSPDGSRLVVNVLIAGTYYLAWVDMSNSQVYLFNSAAGGIKGRYPAYNAAGTKIVYTGAQGTTIEQINADGSGHKVLVSSATGVGDPEISPDGKRVAFDKLNGSQLEIHVKDLVNGGTKRLTSLHFDSQPTWSPDGGKIAFSSDRSGVSQIWTMDAATGGSLTRITHTSTVEKDPSWSH